jgi:hypothetical protein
MVKLFYQTLNKVRFLSLNLKQKELLVDSILKNK